jgi:hypothetical protein
MQAPAELFRYLDFIECFKTKDSPEAREKAMPGYYNEAFATWQEVMHNKNPFFHKLIDTGL